MKLNEYPMIDDLQAPREPSRTSNVVPMLVANRSTHADPKAQELQRLVFYLAGGVVSLLFLMLLANQMNPKDEALRNAPLARVMGNWEGRWVGSETRLTLSGTPLANYKTVRFFASSGAQYQSGTVERTEGNENHAKEVWLTRIDQDGVLHARRNDEGSEEFELFNGTMTGDTLYWSGESQDSTNVVRVWLEGSVLHVEEMHLSRTRPADSFLITGQYRRAEE
ncbi:hypothetical protein GC173_10680 [bacterium]|nr:hypothetical protein [bacterium]